MSKVPGANEPAPKPKVELPVTGIAELRAAKGKGSIDYGDELTTPAPVAAKGAATPAAVPPQEAPKGSAEADFAAKQVELQREIEKVKAQSEAYLAQQNSIIQNQERMIQQLQPKVEAPKEVTDEEIAAVYQEDPIKAMSLISQREAKRVRAETMQQLEAQEQIQAAQTEFSGKQKQFQDNSARIVKENPELADANHRLTQILQGLDTEMPYLLRIPEGPIKAIEIAKQRYELEQLRAAQTTLQNPEVPAAPAKDTTPARDTTQRAANMVSGAPRGTPPTTQVTLTDGETLAARRMRLTPEEYGKFKKNTSAHFIPEAAPKRRTT